MMNFPLIGKIPYGLILIGIIIISPGFSPLIQQNADIILKDEPVTVTPKEFYVAGVVDERDNRTAIAWLSPAPTATNPQPKALMVDLNGGTLIAVRQFIDENLPRNKTLRPLIIRIKKFKVTENTSSAKRSEGQAVLDIIFDLQKPEGETIHLGEYNGTATYTRNAGPAQGIEPTIRHLLENGLEYINTWMNQQVNNNIKLAKGVKISFTYFTEKPEGDTIYYSFSRPLKWDDFQSKKGDDKYEAEVFPSFGYEEKAELVNGIVNIHMSVKAYLPKSACWVKDGSRNNYTLNHEQRHFDLAKIVAEHFKMKLKAADDLTVENYDGPINVEYLEAYREMHTLQKQYDDETRHGIDHAAQQRWNERIDKELKEIGK
jgi:hypothetical protein